MNSIMKKSLLKMYPRIKQINKMSFSTTESVKMSSSESFHDIYTRELEKLKKHSKSVVDLEYKVKKDQSPLEAYKHPYHSEEFPIYWSGTNLLRNYKNAAGPEQVSPHYESFSLSRRVPIIGALFLFGMYNLEQINKCSLYGSSFIYNMYTLVLLGIGVNESRYILMKMPTPKMTWYYNAFHKHEFKQIYNNLLDNLEDTITNKLKNTKEQIDYYMIHKEYHYVKKRVLTSFIENEKINLNSHYQKRALNILKTINNIENSNIKNKISQITQTSLDKILSKVKDSSQNSEIINSSFESALQGLKDGKMEYKGDMILPMFLEELKKETSKIENLSPEEENKLFGLSVDQRKQVISSDNGMKSEYLNMLPEVNTSIKSTEGYNKIVERMKARA